MLNALPIWALLTALLAVAGMQVQTLRVESAAYHDGAEALASGDYASALTSFTSAHDYKDAESRRGWIAVQLAPIARDYARGIAALDANDWAGAIAAFLPIAREFPTYRDVSRKLQSARDQERTQGLATASAANRRGDWATAETILTGLVAIDPEDVDASTALEEIRRNNVPFVFANGRVLSTASLTSAAPGVVTQGIDASWPVWSPDRSRIAFVSPGDRGSAGLAKLYIVDADGSGLQEIASKISAGRAPSWSPDGMRIAYQAAVSMNEHTTGSETVVVADLASGSVHDIIAGRLPNASSPSWSPTGDRLAVVVRAPGFGPGDPALPPPRSSQALRGDIYIWNAVVDTLEPALNGTIIDPWMISWSPIAERIVVFGRADGTSYRRGTISVLDLPTGHSRSFDDSNLDITMPVWSPDGNRFAYVVDSSTVRIVHPGEPDQSYRTDIALSPFLTWSPAKDTLLVLAAAPDLDQSLLLHVEPGQSITAKLIDVHYDVDHAYSGPPSWTPAHVQTPPGLPTIAGTGMDPSNGP